MVRVSARGWRIGRFWVWGVVDSRRRWGKDRGIGFGDWECLARNVLVSGC